MPTEMGDDNKCCFCGAGGDTREGLRFWSLPKESSEEARSDSLPSNNLAYSFLYCLVCFGNNYISIEKLELVSGHHQKPSQGGFVHVNVLLKGSWLLSLTAVTAFLCFYIYTVQSKHMHFADDKRTVCLTILFLIYQRNLSFLSFSPCMGDTDALLKGCWPTVIAWCAFTMPVRM